MTGDTARHSSVFPKLENGLDRVGGLRVQKLNTKHTKLNTQILKRPSYFLIRPDFGTDHYEFHEPHFRLSHQPRQSQFSSTGMSLSSQTMHRNGLPPAPSDDHLRRLRSCRRSLKRHASESDQNTLPFAGTL